MRKVIHTRLGNILEVAGVVLGDDPGLERKAAGIGAERREMSRIQHDPLLDGKLLLRHIAEDAATAIVVDSRAPVISSQTEIGTIGVTIN